jgi:hypothetical protein
LKIPEPSKALCLESADLSQTGKSTLLNLTQGLAATQEGNDANQTSRRQDLEECPRRVVKEEDELHSNDASEEEGVGDGSSVHGLGDVADVCAEEQPGTNENGQTSEDGKSEDAGEDSRRGLGIAAEDVVDLGQFAVTERSLGGAQGRIGVTDDGQVEGVGVVCIGRAE